MIKAILDIPATNGVPDIAFPAGTVITGNGNLRHIQRGRNQLFAYTLLQNRNRWIALVSGSQRALDWLASAGVTVYELTKQFYLANRARLEAIGLTPELRDGILQVRVPHVICGQSPWVDIS